MTVNKPKLSADLLICNAGQLVTCAGGAPGQIGMLEKGWLAVAGERIAAIGSQNEVEALVDCSRASVIDVCGKVVAPGFIDCHTHLVFGGSRVEEYAARMTVDDPEVLAQMGIRTGIMATVDNTRDAPEESLYAEAAARLERMLCAGTTTVESKSGYGLSTTAEIKILRINELLNESGILIVEHSPKENIEVPYSDLINTEKYFKNTNFSWLDSKLYP